MWRRMKTCQKGAAAVEFAIFLPILVLLMGGIIEFGLVLYNQQVITNASREGARAAINPLPEKLTGEEIKQIVVDYCNNRLITFGANSFTSSNVIVNNAGAAEGTDVTVTANYSYQFLLPNIIKLGNTKQLSSITTMRMM